MHHSPAMVLDADAYSPVSRKPFHIRALLASACVVLMGALIWTMYQARMESHFECPPDREVRGGTPPLHLMQWCVIPETNDQPAIADGKFVRWHPTAFRYGKSGRLPLPLKTGRYSMGKKHGVFTRYSLRFPSDAPLSEALYENDVQRCSVRIFRDEFSVMVVPRGEPEFCNDFHAARLRY